MKIHTIQLLIAACYTVLSTLASAQDAAPAAPAPAPAEAPAAADIVLDSNPELPAPAADPNAPAAPAADPNAPAAPAADPNAPAIAADPNAPAAPVDPNAPVAKNDVEQTPEGYIIKDAALNDIFQFLAKSAGRQYFHNLQINGPDFQVTGHLSDGEPLSQMEELAFQYGLSLHTKGNTIYALTQAQLTQLPSTEWHYQLKYLRPTDIEQIKQLIIPMLTPGAGVVNFEPKTNTIIIIDTPTRIESTRNLLNGIDKPKGQIIVETKILRINSTVGEKIGVDWADSLGNTGVPLTVTGQLGNLFGLPTRIDTAADPFTSPVGEFTAERGSIVLTPVQLSGVLKALNEGGISNQVSNPTLITEDNEQATISIIDRVPIITSTTTPGSGGVPPTVSEEVRYKIDSTDKAITQDPENHREIGISIAVTPTLLPDGTIRMRMRPRSAQITGFVEGVGVAGLAGNNYPRVTESMVETLARIPDGNSLIVGGFYGEIQSNGKNKVPLFGDIPVLNFFFKSKETSKEQTSLVFIVTPTSYDPAKFGETKRVTSQLNAKTELPYDYNSADPTNPGPGHEPNFRRTIRGMEPAEAPYYPKADELSNPPSATKSSKSKLSRHKR